MHEARYSFSERTYSDINYQVYQDKFTLKVCLHVYRQNVN